MPESVTPRWANSAVPEHGQLVRRLDVTQPRLWAMLLAFASRASATAPALHCNLVATIAPHASITLSAATAVAAVKVTVRRTLFLFSFFGI